MRTVRHCRENQFDITAACRYRYVGPVNLRLLCRAFHDWTAFRDRFSVTQAGLAVALGVSQRGVEEWERGTRTPPAYLRLALQALTNEWLAP